MSFEFCPKCGANIGGAVACLHCGRMPTPDWPWRSKPPRRRRATSPSIEGDEAPGANALKAASDQVDSSHG